MQSLKSQIAWCHRFQYLLGAGVVVIAAMFYFAGYRPQGERTRLVLDQIKQTQRELIASQDSARQIPDVAKDLARLRSQLADFKKLPTNPDLGDFMRQITEVSKESALRKLEVNFPGGPRKSERYTELPVSLRFEGDFLSVFSFLRQAEDMPRLTRVSNISIRGADLRNGLVQVEMSMSLYFAEGS
jgi:Tfp pilus assembly protein PilO